MGSFPPTRSPMHRPTRSPSRSSDRMDTLLARGPGAETVVSLRSPDTDRLVVLHLRTIEAERGTRQLLAISSECIWPERLSELLADAFDLTAAEIGVLRAITAGDTVAQIAGRAGRSQGTVRTQIHALLAKTGARSQVELVRLTNLLLRSLPSGGASGAGRPPPADSAAALAAPSGRATAGRLRLRRSPGTPGALAAVDARAFRSDAIGRCRPAPSPHVRAGADPRRIRRE